jgi:hypothetical protein
MVRANRFVRLCNHIDTMSRLLEKRRFGAAVCGAMEALPRRADRAPGQRQPIRNSWRGIFGALNALQWS